MNVHMSRFRLSFFVMLLGAVAGCAQPVPPALTVADVWRDAVALAGQQIRVQGQADFDFLPSHPGRVGCAVLPEVRAAEHYTGVLRLVDGTDATQTLTIADTSLRCVGNSCNINCTPFAPADSGGLGVPEPITAFEFEGTLAVVEVSGVQMLELSALDLDQSRRLYDGRWQSIPEEEKMYFFP